MSVTGYVGLIGAVIAATAITVHVIDTQSSDAFPYARASQLPMQVQVQAQPTQTFCASMSPGTVTCNTN